MQFGIIDLSGFVVPHWTALDVEVDSCGNGIHAVLAFSRHLFKLREDHSHLAVCVDRGSAHRRVLLPTYKSNRPEKDADLVRQLKLCEHLCEAHGVPIVAKEGYEADDCIATLVKRLEASGKADVVVIHANDKDMRQLLSERTSMWSKKAGWYTVRTLRADWGIRPDQCVDYQAIAGDSTDGIPGVKGIGGKTAQWLIGRYETLDGVYDNLEEIKATLKIGTFKGETIAGRLWEHQGDAIISWKLCKLVDDLELDVDPKETKVSSYPPSLFKFMDWLEDPKIDPDRYEV
jgi:DNA polymerase I